MLSLKKQKSNKSWLQSVKQVSQNVENVTEPENNLFCKLKVVKVGVFLKVKKKKMVNVPLSENYKFLLLKGTR